MSEKSEKLAVICRDGSLEERSAYTFHVLNNRKSIFLAHKRNGLSPNDFEMYFGISSDDLKNILPARFDFAVKLDEPLQIPQFKEPPDFFENLANLLKIPIVIYLQFAGEKFPHYELEINPDGWCEECGRCDSVKKSRGGFSRIRI